MQKSRFSYIRSISSFFYILLGGQIFLALILIGLVYVGHLNPFPWEYYSGNLTILGIAVVIICRFAANYMYKNKLQEIQVSNESIKKKLEDYMTANIQRWAILEFSILFCIILIYLSGNLLLIFLTVFMIVRFLLTWPRSRKIIADLEIEL